MKKILVYSITFVCIILFSCDKHKDNVIEPQLVVEGWIETDGFPIVLIGKTLPISNSSQDINNYVVQWAKVSISDGDTTIILTGGYDNTYLPPYKYTTYKMTGKAGKTYHIDVEYRGLHASATTTIPEVPQIDSVRSVCCDNDTSYFIKAYFKDNPSQKDYYVMFSKRSTDKVYLFPFLGAITDENQNENISANIYRGTDYYSSIQRENEMYFKKGETVQIKVCHVDENSYLFWKSYSDLKNFSSNMFFPYSKNLESNIIGGKGYWCGYGTAQRTLIIK